MGETPRPVVRVIAGELGGRRIQAPRGRETRPTSDRVRESLFMALEPLADLRVVDLFAGSGAMGIEALSRGAARVDFVESSAAARRVLASNLAELGLEDRAVVWPYGLPGGIARLKHAIDEADLILLDPPYGGEMARATLAALGASALQPACRVVVEHHAKDELPERVGSMRIVRRRRHGETTVSTYEVATGEAGAATEEGR